MTTLEIPSHYPDLAPADFYLYPLLKLALKGLRFSHATNVIKNATEELKRPLQISSINVSITFQLLAEINSCKWDCFAGRIA